MPVVSVKISQEGTGESSLFFPSSVVVSLFRPGDVHEASDFSSVVSLAVEASRAAVVGKYGFLCLGSVATCRSSRRWVDGQHAEGLVRVVSVEVA